jgi:hypothetical protein
MTTAEIRQMSHLQLTEKPVQAYEFKADTGRLTVFAEGVHLIPG